MSNTVNREEPILIIAEIQQGENKVGGKTAIHLEGWTSLTSEERKQIVESTARATLEHLLKELTYE